MQIKIQCDPKLARVIKGELELRRPQHPRPKRLATRAAPKRKRKHSES
jgi:hypothetical protein